MVYLIATALLLGASTDEPWFSGSQLVMLGAIIIVTAVMLRATRRKLRDARNTPKAYARDMYERLKEERSAVNDVQTVMVELEQLARQIHGQIDTKFAKLEAVIRDADRRIETLSRLERASKGGPALDVVVGEGESEAEERPQPASSCPENHKAVRRLSEAGLKTIDIANETGKTVGEVELILALLRTRDQAADPLEAN